MIHRVAIFALSRLHTKSQLILESHRQGRKALARLLADRALFSLSSSRAVDTRDIGCMQCCGREEAKGKTKEGKLRRKEFGPYG
jgi:hypothetical protein